MFCGACGGAHVGPRVSREDCLHFKRSWCSHHSTCMAVDFMGLPKHHFTGRMNAVALCSAASYWTRSLEVVPVGPLLEAWWGIRGSHSKGRIKDPWFWRIIPHIDKGDPLARNASPCAKAHSFGEFAGGTYCFGSMLTYLACLPHTLGFVDEERCNLLPKQAEDSL